VGTFRAPAAFAWQRTEIMDVFAYRLLQTALPLALLAIVAGRAAYVVARRRPGAEPGSPRRAATRALLASYALGLGWWTVVIANPSQDGSRHANLVPFREIARSLTVHVSEYGLLNFWGNIVAFVPVGALALLSFPRNWRRAWLVAWAGGAALSAVLEISQYVVGRSADIDDVILNAVGVGLGVALALVARRLPTPGRAVRFRTRQVRRISLLTVPTSPPENHPTQ
jgi:glycopeptide antibiotics resistance protein